MQSQATDQHVVPWRQADTRSLFRIFTISADQRDAYQRATRAAADAVEVEQADRLRLVEQFHVAMRPAEAQQIVAQCFGQIAHIAVSFDAERAVAFGEFCAIRAVDQWNVRINRLRPVHRADNAELAEGVVEMVVAADHMGHAHVMIVNHHRQHVGRRAVRTQQDHVIELRVLDYHTALHCILDHALAIYNERHKRVTTGEFNNFLQQIILDHPPTGNRKSHRPKVFYGTQVEVNPPKFVISVNNSAHFHFSYSRYIENRIREAFGFQGTPISLELKGRVSIFKEKERIAKIEHKKKQYHETGSIYR